MHKQLVEIIQENKVALEEGNIFTVLFEDGIATICKDEFGVTRTYFEEIPLRIEGSIYQFKTA